MSISTTAAPGSVADPLFEYLLRLGDDRLVLGHRTSEWCGHAPILEEDIALANIALDLIGQATHCPFLSSRKTTRPPSRRAASSSPSPPCVE